MKKIFKILAIVCVIALGIYLVRGMIICASWSESGNLSFGQKIEIFDKLTKQDSDIGYFNCDFEVVSSSDIVDVIRVKFDDGTKHVYTVARRNKNVAPNDTYE